MSRMLDFGELLLFKYVARAYVFCLLRIESSGSFRYLKFNILGSYYPMTNFFPRTLVKS
jgi:hypothetical protein